MVGRQVQLLNSKTSVSQVFLGRPLSHRLYALLQARAASARPAISLASLFILTAFLVVLAVQPAISDTAKLELLDRNNNVIKTINSVPISCSCPCTGVNCQRYCETSYNYPRTCTTPGWVKGRLTVTHSSKECDGKSTQGGTSVTSISNLYECNDIATIKYYDGLGTHRDTAVVEAGRTCPCTGTNCQAESTFTHTYNSCKGPGMVEARITVQHGRNECDGQPSQGTTSYFTKKIYECPEFGQIKIYHETAGLIKTINNIKCTTSCPCTTENCQRQTDCSYSYPKSGCTIPGKYKAEATVTHAMPECDGKASGVVGGTSSVTKHDLFTCDIKDKGTYYVYPPGVTNPKTSGYAWKKDVDCTASCPSDKVYTSTCPTVTIDKPAICANTGGWYSVNTYIQHKGQSCINGGNLYVKNSWVDNTNVKAFSCGLDMSAKVSFYVGSHYFINKKAMTCPDVIAEYDASKGDVGLHSCTYSAWTPPAGTYVTVGGEKRYCEKEGDYNTKVDFTFSGKNWDGSNLHGGSHLKESLTVTKYNVNWDGHSGTYCTTTCFNDKTSGDSGVGWNLGGETASTTCCGDDGGEWYRTCTSNELVKNACSGDGVACCSHKTDCVSKNNCYANGWQGDADGDKATEKCNSGTWEDVKEYAQIRVSHATVGLLHTQNSVECTTSCPSGTSGEAQSYQVCSWTYSSSGCKIPGKYQAEVTLDHNRPTCSGLPMAASTPSQIGKHDLFTCNIIDKGSYYVYPPGVTAPKTSGYSHKKDVDCPASCPSDQVYTSSCPGYNVPEAAICSSRSGFYTVNSRIQHKGYSCKTGSALHHTTSWSDNTNVKAFSCGLDTAMKVTYKGGSHTYFSNKAMSCPSDQFSHDPANNGAVIDCTYSGWSPNKYVTVSGQKRQCDKEGDHVMTVTVSYSGKNWDGTNLGVTSDSLSNTLYNVNWDGHSGTYCSTSCRTDQTTGSLDSGMGWNLGGETAATTCCGDDGSEWYRTCATDETIKNACNGDNKACCNAQKDCVSFGSCYNNGKQVDADSDGAIEYCVNGVWQDAPEYAQIRIYHQHTGNNVIKTFNNVLCSTNSCSGTSSETQRYHECPVTYSSSGCKIPGWYQAETTIDHKRTECDGAKVDIGKQSSISRHNLFQCTVNDDVTYYVFKPGVTSPTTSSSKRVWSKSMTCPVSCSSGTYQVDCGGVAIDEAALCNNAHGYGYYSLNARYVHNGHSCVNGQALKHTTSWSDNTNLKVFSCSLTASAKTWFYVGGHYFVNAKAMTCPKTYSHNPAKNDAVEHACTYTAWTPPAGTFVDVGGQKRYCQKEGDYIAKVEYTFSGKNWDGSNLHGGSHLKESWTNTQYNVAWDGHSGTYCNPTCVSDTTTGAHDNGIAWNIGGETAASSCCGDDGSEWYRTCETNEDTKNACNGDNKACCKARYDCVSFGNCYDNGWTGDADGDKAQEKCVNGAWQDLVEYSQVRIYHETAGLIKTQNNVACTTTCPSGTGAYAQRQQECKFDYYECYIPGWYQAETTVNHNRPNCDGKAMVAGTTSVIGKHNLYNCVITDHVTYYAYDPSGTKAWTSAKKDCSTVCHKPVDKYERKTDCPSVTVPETSFCTKRNGYYSTKAYMEYSGRNCHNGNFYAKNEWFNYGQAFSCALDTTMQVWYWVGGHYYVNAKWLTCPTDQFSYDPSNHNANVACTYTGWSPDKYVNAGGQKRQCDREGDHNVKVRVHYAGKNWDGSTLENAYQDLTSTLYNVNWDGHSGTYCSTSCFTDKTTGAMDSGVAWNLGGEIAASSCCGDDNNEWYRTCASDEQIKNACNGDNKACCNSNKDCVGFGSCKNNGWQGDIDSDGAIEWCVNGVWQDAPEYAEIRIYHQATGNTQLHKFTGVLCSSTCANSASETQRDHECKYDFHECKIPGWYQAETNIEHKRLNCDGTKIETGKTSAISRHNLYNCVIKDKIRYYFYVPGTTSPSTSTYAHRSAEKECDASCSSGSRESNCQTYNFNWADFCSSRNGYYTSNAYINHVGNNCINGGALKFANSWVDKTNLKVFSCSLVLNAKLWFWVGGHYFINNKAMSCPQVIAINPSSDEGGVQHECKYTSYTPEADKSVTIGGNKNYCRIEGDYKTKVDYTFTGKNWDGVAIQGNSLLESRTRTQYTVNWDTKDYCHKNCVNKDVWWSIHSNDGGSRHLCCGDDANEYRRTNNADSTDACCDKTDDCVFANNCYANSGCAHTSLHLSDAATNGEYCKAGTWVDLDDNSNYCKACHGNTNYNIGGEIDKCCGDDAGEYRKVSNADSTDACCNNNNDCTNGNTCYSQGTCLQTNHAGSNEADYNGEYCQAGTWRDQDDSATYCNACGSNKYNIGGDVAKCCEDDANEFIRTCETQQDAGAGCAGSSDNLACCDKSTDCVFNGNCYATGWSGDIDNDYAKEKCVSGKWQDSPEYAQIRIFHNAGGKFYTIDNVLCTSACPGASGYVTPPEGAGDIKLRIMDQSNNVVDTFYPECSITCSGGKRTITCSAFKYTACPVAGKIKARLDFPAYPDESGCKKQAAESTDIVDLYTCAEGGKERTHECPYDFNECLVPGTYQAEATINHNRGNCDGMPMVPGGTSAISKHNLYTCTITDKVNYRLYKPEGGQAWDSGKKDCTTACVHNGQAYELKSECPTITIPETTVCSSNKGYYTLKGEIKHAGRNCYNKDFKNNPIWIDRGKIFSCSLTTTMQVYYYVGGHYYVNGEWASCPADQFSKDPTNHNANVECTYSGWNPDRYVTVSGQKRQCDREGDHYFKARVHYAGNNWDGTTLEDAYQDLTKKEYNIEWDGHSGTYCTASCFDDRTTGAKDKGIVWNIGGEVHGNKCCGDDNNEWYRFCETIEEVATACDRGADDLACCNDKNDCVYNNGCYNNGYNADVDGDKAKEKCENGVWKENPEYAQIRIFHDYAGKIHTINNVECSSTCPNKNGYTERSQSCPYDFYECLAPGWYSTEGTLYHDRANCDSTPMIASTTSVFGRVNMYNCVITDEVRYKIISPKTSKAYQADRTCSTGCVAGGDLQEINWHDTNGISSRRRNNAADRLLTCAVAKPIDTCDEKGWYKGNVKYTYEGKRCDYSANMPATEEFTRNKLFFCYVGSPASVDYYVYDGSGGKEWNSGALACHSTGQLGFCSNSNEISSLNCPSKDYTLCKVAGKYTTKAKFTFESPACNDLPAVPEEWHGPIDLYRCSPAYYRIRAKTSGNIKQNWKLMTCHKGACTSNDNKELDASCTTEWVDTAHCDEEGDWQSQTKFYFNKECDGKASQVGDQTIGWDTIYNVNWDTKRYCTTVCTGKTVYWDIGGVGGTRHLCCQDDGSEYKIDCVSQEKQGSNACSVSTDDTACCDQSNDCLYQNVCYNNAWEGDVDGDGHKEYCAAGTWRDLPIVTAKITIQNLEKVQVNDATVSCTDVDCGVAAGTTSCAYNNGNDKVECTFFSQASGVWCTGSCSYSYNMCTVGGLYTGHVDFKYTGWNMGAAAFDEATRYLVTGEQNYYHCGYTTTATVWVFDPDSTVIDNAATSCGLTMRNNGYAYGTTVCGYAFNPDGTNYFDLTATSYTPKKPPTPSADIVETRKAKYCRKEGDYTAKVRFAYTGTMFGNSPGEMSALTATSQEYTEKLFTVNWDQSDGYWCDLACFDDQTAGDGGIEHAIGGDDTQCCGDDADNWITHCVSREKAGVNLCVYSSDDKACCDQDSDCIFNDKCYDDGFSEDLDFDDMPEFCDEGIWKDMPGIASKIWIWNQENQRVDAHSMTCGTVMCGPISGSNQCTYDEPANEMACDYYLFGCIDCTAPCFYGYNECTIGGWYYGYTEYLFTDIPCGTERNKGDRVYPVSYAQPLGPTANMWYYCGYTATAKLWFNTPVGTIRAGQDMTCGPLTYRFGNTPNGNTACSYQFKDPANTGTHFWTIDSLSTSPTAGTQTWTENDLFCRHEGEYSTDVIYYYTGRMFDRSALTATQQTIHKFLYHVNWDDELSTNKAPDGSSHPSRYCGPKCVSDTTPNDEQNNLLDGSKDGIAWGIGGDDGGTRNKCCGDDANEFIHYCKSLEHSVKACKGDQVQDVACCDKTTDCVANNKCYDDKWEGDVDSDGANEYCNQGSWKDLPRVTAKIWVASPEKPIRESVDITCSALNCGVPGGATSCTYPDSGNQVICTFYSTFTGVSCIGTCTYNINECTVGGAYDGHVEFTYQGWNSPTESFSLKTEYANVVEHDQYYYFCGYETESLITIDKPTGRVIDHTGMTCDLTFRNGNSDQGTTHCGYIFKPDGTNYFDIDAYSTSLTTWNWARTYREHYCREEGDYTLTVDFSYHGENNRHALDRDRRFDNTPNANDPALGITAQQKVVVMYKVSWDDDGNVNLDPDGRREPARYCDLRCFDDRTPPATKPFDKGIGWEQGGDIGKCCGDDDNEWMLDCRSEEKPGTKKACESSTDNNRACCNEYTDCIANNKCFNDKWEGDVDSDGLNEYCHQGVWKSLPKVTAKLYIQSPKDRQDGTYFDGNSAGRDYSCTAMDCGVASGITSCSYPYNSDTSTCTYYSTDFLGLTCKATCTLAYNGCKTGGTYDGKTDFVLEGYDGTRDLDIDSSYINAAETNQQYYYFCGYETTSALTFKRPGATVFTDQGMSCGLTSRSGSNTYGLGTCTKTVTDSSVGITSLDLIAKTTGYASADITWNWKNWYCRWEGDYKTSVTFTYHGEKDRKGAWSDDRKDRRFGDVPTSDNDLLTNGAGLSHPGHRVTDLLLYSVDWDDKKGTNKDPITRVASPSVYCRLDCFNDKTTTQGDFGIAWNLGGDAPDGKTACCGDDNNEFYLKFFTTDLDGPYTQNDVDQEVADLEPGAMNKYDACCDKANDCVWDNQCYAHGVTICIASGQQQDIRKCENNVWKTIQTCADGHRCEEGGTNRLLYLDGSCVDSNPKGTAKCEYDIDESRTVQCRTDATDCPEDEQNVDGSCKSLSGADRGDDTKAPGVCIDYLGCSDNVCAKRIYRDTCRTEGDTWVFEYLRSGSTCIGHWVDCEGHEYNKCATELIEEDNDTYNGKINIYNAFGINYQCKLNEKGRGFCWDQERLPATLTNFTCDPFVCDVESHKCTDFCTKAKHCAGGEIGRSICIEGDEDPDKGVCGFSCRPIDNSKWYQKWDPLNPNSDPQTGEYRGLCCNQITISGNLWGTFYIEMFREPPPIIISNTTMDMIVYTFPEHVKFAETSPRVYGDGTFETKFEKAGELEKACFNVGQYFLEIVLPDYEVSTTKLLTVSTKEDGRSLKVQIGDLTLPTGS